MDFHHSLIKEVKPVNGIQSHIQKSYKIETKRVIDLIDIVFLEED